MSFHGRWHELWLADGSISAVEDVAIYDNILNNIGYSDSNQGHCIYTARGAERSRSTDKLTELRVALMVALDLD